MPEPVIATFARAIVDRVTESVNEGHQIDLMVIYGRSEHNGQFQEGPQSTGLDVFIRDKSRTVKDHVATCALMVAIEELTAKGLVRLHITAENPPNTHRHVVFGKGGDLVPGLTAAIRAMKAAPAAG